jgi:DNA repair protein RecO (recombination protein O)
MFVTMVFNTKGIVLRTVKYGETSVIVAIYTELFGIQSYLVNGVRTATKKGPAKANLFQPAAILDLEVYHNELKNLQRLKDFKWSYLYRHVFSDVLKHSVAVFMIELLQKTLKQPEHNPDLYHFIEDAFMHLDESELAVTANFPLFFALHLATFFGFRFEDDYDDEHKPFLDLKEGEFVPEQPIHPYFLGGQYSFITSQLLRTMQPHELTGIKLNKDMRRVLLHAYENYYALHITDFGTLKTLPVLQEVLS